MQERAQVCKPMCMSAPGLGIEGSAVTGRMMGETELFTISDCAMACLHPHAVCVRECMSMPVSTRMSQHMSIHTPQAFQ